MFNRKILTGCLVLAIMAALITPVNADELSNQKQLLDKLNQQRTQQQNNLNQTSRAEKTILGQVESIEQDTIRTQQDIDKLEVRIKNLQDKIDVLEAQIKIEQEELDRQTDILAERLVVIYEQGDSSYLEVLLGANDVKDLITRVDMLTTIIDQDQDLIDEISRRKLALDNKKADLDVQQKELLAAKTTLEEKKQQLAVQLQEKKDVLSSIQQEKEKYAQAIRELEQASAQAEAMIQKLQGSSGVRQGTGSYTWPTPGYSNITSPYGMRYHPILKTNKLHTGIDIGAPSGAKIVAADGGSVIFSGWLGAYGNAIIVDHGAGISTLYGHLSSCSVGVGAKVSQGQTIGKVGSTGWSTGPHLHFEVRKNGSAVNPNGYI